MRVLLIILLTGYCLAGHGQGGQRERNVRIDSFLRQVVARTEKFSDSIGWYADQALEVSKKEGYNHGIALSLACKAAYTVYYLNDFILAEQQARQSLDWFGRTNNKDFITVAWYDLGFAVFAQSRFDEAIGYLQRAQAFAREAGDSANVIHSLSLIGCSYRESGNYEKAFEISRRCLQMAADNHFPGILEAEYFELAA